MSVSLNACQACQSPGIMARNEGYVLLSTVTLLLRPGRGADIKISLLLCLYIEPLDRSSPIFGAYPLWPWLPLSPSLVALRYAMYFGFEEEVTFGRNGPCGVAYFNTGAALTALIFHEILTSSTQVTQPFY